MTILCKIFWICILLTVFSNYWLHIRDNAQLSMIEIVLCGWGCIIPPIIALVVGIIDIATE